MSAVTTITPFLWYDTEAEQAAEFYVSVFGDGAITAVSRYPDEGQEVHEKSAGSVMTVSFRILNQSLVALNGGPKFPFTEAFSLAVTCEDGQAEVDHVWNSLIADGGEESMCGWLKDRFGLSWQVVPSRFHELLADGTPEQSQRVMKAMLQMRKLDLAALERAYAG